LTGGVGEGDHLILLQEPPFIVKDKMKYWPGGVWGNPQKASAKKGEKALKLLADKIIEILEEIERHK